MSPRSYLQNKGNTNALAHRAVAVASASHTEGTVKAVGLCLQRVRECYGIGAQAPDAVGAWNLVPTKWVHTWYTPPLGTPVFWSGGSAGHGHIAIADGQGNVWSTDILRPGYWDLVPTAMIHSKWDLTYLGWTELLNGVRVYGV